MYIYLSHTRLDLYTPKPYRSGYICPLAIGGWIYISLAITGWIYIHLSHTGRDLFIAKPYDALFIYPKAITG